MGNPPDELEKMPLTVPVLSILPEMSPEPQGRLCFVIVI